MVTGVAAGALIGQFVPGVSGRRGAVWPIAGVLVALITIFGVALLRRAQASLGKLTGVAALVATAAILAGLLSITPFGCSPCSINNTRDWAAVGFAIGLWITTAATLAAFTRFGARVSRRLTTGIRSLRTTRTTRSSRTPRR